MKQAFTRRDALRATLAGGMGLAASGLVPAAAVAEQALGAAEQPPLQAAAVGNLDSQSGPGIDFQDKRAVVFVEDDINSHVAEASKLVAAGTQFQHGLPGKGGPVVQQQADRTQVRGARLWLFRQLPRLPAQRWPAR